MILNALFYITNKTLTEVTKKALLLQVCCLFNTIFFKFEPNLKAEETCDWKSQALTKSKLFSLLAQNMKQHLMGKKEKSKLWVVTNRRKLEKSNQN